MKVEKVKEIQEKVEKPVQKNIKHEADADILAFAANLDKVGEIFETKPVSQGIPSEGEQAKEEIQEEASHKELDQASE
jgi:hypothetical protein